MVPVEFLESDEFRVVLLGMYGTIDGERRNAFKRGADSFPQIDRPCYAIEASNLQRLMGLLAAGIKADERLRLGAFVADREAAAVADGSAGTARTYRG